MQKYKKILALLLICFLCSSLSACGKNEEIQDLVDDFEYACQNMDVHAILNCLDPTYAKPILIILNAIDYFTDVDAENKVEDITNSVVSYVFSTDYEATEVLKGFSIEKEKIKIKKDKATVDCEFKMILFGEELIYDASITCENIHDEWYITKISKPNSSKEKAEKDSKDTTESKEEK